MASPEKKVLDTTFRKSASMLANEVVEEWIAAGKIPPMAWDFRGLCEAAIAHARFDDIGESLK